LFDFVEFDRAIPPGRKEQAKPEVKTRKFRFRCEEARRVGFGWRALVKRIRLSEGLVGTM
jgi:hypothetical protein